MINKKGDLSINVIIVAALALVVFVVLAAMFTGKSKNFTGSLEDCTSKQGQCVEKSTCDGAIVANTNCPKTDKNKPTCCISGFS